MTGTLKKHKGRVRDWRPSGGCVAIREAFDPAKSNLIRGLRAKRMQNFFDLIRSCPRPVRILDVGGISSTWQGFDVLDNQDYQLTILNLYPEPARFSNVKMVLGDATDMRCFRDLEFDAVFSNSLIEHVGGPERRQKCADEIRRVGRIHYVQTPNYYFPIEPHFLLPFMQFLPLRIQALYFLCVPIGHVRRRRSMDEALREIGRIHLLRRRNLQELFPESELIEERFMGLVKSFSAVSKRDSGESIGKNPTPAD